MKFAIRQLLKSPGFTIISLVTLALGIGVNTTAFSILNRLLLQSLPFPEAGRMVKIVRTEPGQDSLGQSPGDFFDEQAQNNVFEHMAVYYTSGAASLAEVGQASQPATVLPSSADFPAVLGVNPILGRGYSADDAVHRAKVILLSNAYWQRHYGGSEKVLGHTLRLNGDMFTIIGVMPPQLDDPLLFGNQVDVWNLDPTDINRTTRDKTWYQIAARLKPGVSVAQAQAVMSAIAARLAHDYPKTNAHRGFKVEPYPTDSMGDVGRNVTWMIMDLSLVVLLIACVNLANLQLVRTTARAREFAIRLALGSERMRLVRMLLLESLIISFAGGALGLLVAKWGNLYVAAFFSMEMPLEFRVLAFAFAVAALTGITFGTLPAIMASRADVNSALKQGSRGATSDRSRHGLRQSLIVVELAMALTLLTGAGFFVRGIQKIMTSEQGWRPENLLLGFAGLSHDTYGEENDPRSVVFAGRMRAELLAMPGADHAAITRGGFSILDAGFGGEGFLIEGQPRPAKGKEPQAGFDIISTDYFGTVGMHLLQGRDIADSDRIGAPRVAIINQALGEKFFPGENPIGRRISGITSDTPDWTTIIGVVNNINGMGNTKPAGSHYEIYQPFAQNSHRFVAFVVHTTNDARTYKDGLRKVLAKVEPNAALGFCETAQDIMKQSMRGFSFVRRILVEIAVLGLLLSSIGIYGVVANLVSERTQEIGIRMALGAQPGDVQWLMLRNGVILAAIGITVGLVTSYWLMTVLLKMLAFVPGGNPWMLASVAGLLTVVALIACWLPSRRATKVNPIVALRAE